MGKKDWFERERCSRGDGRLRVRKWIWAPSKSKGLISDSDREKGDLWVVGVGDPEPTGRRLLYDKEKNSP